MSSRRRETRAAAHSSQKFDPHSSDRKPLSRSTSRPHRIHSSVPTSPPDHSTGRFRPFHPPPQSSRTPHSDQPAKPPARSFPYPPSAIPISICSRSRPRPSIYKSHSPARHNQREYMPPPLIS